MVGRQAMLARQIAKAAAQHVPAMPMSG